MPPIAWQLQKHLARLQCDRLSAMVDVRRPVQGIVDIRTDAGRLAGAHLLAVAIPSFLAGDADSLIEHYARGIDLMTAYKQSADRPVRVDALWRTLSPAPSEQFVAAVQLVVSVRTHVSDSRPALRVQSDLPVGQARRLVDADSGRYELVAAASAIPTAMQPAEGPGCLLFRPPGIQLSYAEMVHPADFQHDELLGTPEGDGRMRVSHHLFPVRLEKGVILRARVRGVFLPRDGDAHIAARCYQSFATAEPPLDT